MMDPVPGRPISSNPGLKSLFRFCILPSYVFLRATFCVIITERYFEVKSQQYSLYKLELHHGGGGVLPYISHWNVFPQWVGLFLLLGLKTDIDFS